MPERDDAAGTAPVEAATENGLTEKVKDFFSGRGGADVVRVSDLSDGCGSKFLIYVVSSAFEGVPLIARHKMVHEAIGAALLDRIHAVTIKSWTLAQYEKKRAAGKVPF